MNTEPVVVIPKTEAQARRSAWYTTLAGVGMGLMALMSAFVAYAPQLATAFPKYDWIPKAAMAVGVLLLASQRFTSAGTSAVVNYSIPPDTQPPPYAEATRRTAPPMVEEMGPRIYGPGGRGPPTSPPPPPVGDVAPPWGATSADMAHGADIADKLKDDQT